jgi:hypothetical protein
VLPNVFGQTNNGSQCGQTFSAKQTIAVSVAKRFRPNKQLKSVLPNVFGQTNHCSQRCQMFSAKQTIAVSVAKCFRANPQKFVQLILLLVKTEKHPGQSFCSQCCRMFSAKQTKKIGNFGL